ncbi:MAG: DUF294 nucleotidyltransferase-like domain-containing protein, partial [Candidatus Methylomirabilis sp.]|nr:DUF294 nucleotidyltransferase-like domain-containing protein [Deltaproteobacteria bacterium]
PDQALLGVDRFLAAVGARTAYYALLAENPGVVERLVRLFGSSEFLSAFLIAHPWLLDPLIRSDSASVRKTPERVAAELREQLVHALDLEEKLAVLRRFKNEETLRIGVHDLQEELDIDETTRQLSYVAEACLGGALAIAEEQLRPRYGTPCEAGGQPATFAVVGMGKLGSRELNYNSDLDVIFLYSAGGETRSGARSISNQEYFVKLAQRIITALTTVTADGAVYAIDTRLRPSGNQGSLVTTGTAFVDYHRRTAALWERQALLKARAVAGDLPFGERALAEVRDYMWTLPFTTADLAEIRRLRARMGEELARKGGDATRNLKYGPGGLIDVEFLVQAGQLQRGSRNVPPEDRPVAPGLRMMKEMGLLTAEEAGALADGYRFLRRLENRLRIVHDQADEALPEDPRLLTPLALRMGFAGEGAAEQLLARYREATAAIEKIV